MKPRGSIRDRVRQNEKDRKELFRHSVRVRRGAIDAAGEDWAAASWGERLAMLEEFLATPDGAAALEADRAKDEERRRQHQEEEQHEEEAEEEEQKFDGEAEQERRVPDYYGMLNQGAPAKKSASPATPYSSGSGRKGPTSLFHRRAVREQDQDQDQEEKQQQQQQQQQQRDERQRPKAGERRSKRRSGGAAKEKGAFDPDMSGLTAHESRTFAKLWRKWREEDEEIEAMEASLDRRCAEAKTDG